VPTVLDDDFDPDKSVFSKDRNDRHGWERFFDNGHYVIRHFYRRPPEDWGTSADAWYSPLDAISGDLACQVVCRVVTERDTGWAVGFFTPNRERDLGVRLRRDGAVEVGNFLWSERSQGPVTMLGPIRVPTILPGDEFNTLLVVLHGGQTLAIYVNGSAIARPIQLESPLTPVSPGVGLWERIGHPEQNGRAEFKRFKVWRLPPAEPKP
jgi:hypothetical protein